MKILFNTIFCKIMNLQFCKKKFQWKPEFKKYFKRTNANLLLISYFPFQRWYKLNLLQLKTSGSYPKRILTKSNFTRSLHIIKFIGLIENMNYFCFRIWKKVKDEKFIKLRLILLKEKTLDVTLIVQSFWMQRVEGGWLCLPLINQPK